MTRFCHSALYALALASLLGVSGCGSVLTESTIALSGVAGAATGAAITKNATVAAALGLGVDSLAREGLRYAERRVHRYEQDRIAATAGSLAVNGVAAWSVSHDIPIEADEQGQVTVSREFGAMDFRCKEIVFSVDTVTKAALSRDTATKAALSRAFYTATICSDGQTWRWATAEPTTRRWSGLQ